jgi:uncharacterized protein (TIGR03435 family)
VFRSFSIAVLFTALSIIAAEPSFDAVSIRPNTSASLNSGIQAPTGGRLRAVNVTLQMLVMRAYKMKAFEVFGGPGWVNTDRFDISAISAETSLDEPRFKLMLQTMLADRFHLQVHRETKQMSVYALVLSKGGRKLPDAVATCFPRDQGPPPPKMIPCGSFLFDGTHLIGRGVSMPDLLTVLSDMLGRLVVDKTAYSGSFDVTLEFSPEGIARFSRGGFETPALDPNSDNQSKPTIFSALQQQLGLRLESQKGPVEILVIDHAERPSPD